MKKVGAVLFLALAALFFVATPDAAAQSTQLVYSETYADTLDCILFEGTPDCVLGEPKETFRLIGTIVMTKEMVDQLITFPESASITIDLADADPLGVLLGGTFASFDISPINFSAETCFAAGAKTCTGTDVDGNTINMRATRNTIRFTFTGSLAQLSEGLVPDIIPLGRFRAPLAAEVFVGTFSDDTLTGFDFEDAFLLDTKGALLATDDPRIAPDVRSKVFLRAVGTSRGTATIVPAVF